MNLLNRREAISRGLTGILLYVSWASARANVLICDASAGPCTSLIPTFETPIATTDGFTAQVSNYDANYTWAANSTAGSASISGSGLVTVTGLTPGQSTTVTVQTDRGSGYVPGSAVVSGSSIAGPAEPIPALPIWGVAALGGALSILVKKFEKTKRVQT